VTPEHNKSRIAFCPALQLQFVVLPLSQNFAATPKTLIGVSALLLFAAGIFGALNIAKVKTLRLTVADAVAARNSAEHNRAKQVKEFKARESAIAAEQAKLGEREGKAGAAESQLRQILNEKTQLESKLQDKESEILTLQKQIEEKQPA
jgi:predicted nuclease with TOPRIM domain